MEAPRLELPQVEISPDVVPERTVSVSPDLDGKRNPARESLVENGESNTNASLLVPQEGPGSSVGLLRQKRSKTPTKRKVSFSLRSKTPSANFLSVHPSQPGAGNLLLLPDVIPGSRPGSSRQLLSRDGKSRRENAPRRVLTPRPQKRTTSEENLILRKSATFHEALVNPPQVYSNTAQVHWKTYVVWVIGFPSITRQ